MSVDTLQIAGQIVSRETVDTLREFEGLVRHWNPAINLVSKASLSEIWERHIVDSVQLFKYCPVAATTWMDMGSGGGFPGLVIAILACKTSPDLKITLVESDARKATFLRHATQRLGLSTEVITGRIESLPAVQADIISARALAPLVELLPHALRHLKPGGVALFPKGARHLDEIAAARQAWSFDVESHASLSDPDAAILVIRNIERAKQN